MVLPESLGGILASEALQDTVTTGVLAEEICRGNKGLVWAGTEFWHPVGVVVVREGGRRR